MPYEQQQEPGLVQAKLTRATEDPSSPQNDAVVSLGAHGRGGCSGVLISPMLVLTAGHCFAGAIEDGGSGNWDSRTPIWKDFQMPEPSPNADWVTGIKGRSRIYEGHIIAGFDYRNTVVDNPDACRALCDAEEQCVGWTYKLSERRCFLKQQPSFTVFFGNRHGSPHATRQAHIYSVAGYADIGIMRLEEPVPPDIAIPARVMSHLFDDEAEIRDFLRRQHFEAVGFSMAQPTRRKAAMSYSEYPLREDLVMLRVAGENEATIEGGDSGSPLFLLRRQPDGSTQRYVIGICQGVEGGGGRYTLTGVNLAVRGSLLSFPYDSSRINRRVAAPIGEWLNNVLYADFISRHSVVPLYSWSSASAGDNFLTSDPRWASDPLGIVPDESGQYLDPQRRQNGDYRMFRLEGYAFNPKKPQPAGTVPLWLWYHSERKDNFSTTDPRWSSDLPVRWEGENIADHRSQEGYTLQSLEGFIYDPKLPQPPNTRPLFSWWCPARGDNFATTDPAWAMDPATVRWSGEHITNGRRQHRPEYQLYRLEGYVPAEPVAL